MAGVEGRRTRRFLISGLAASGLAASGLAVLGLVFTGCVTGDGSDGAMPEESTARRTSGLAFATPTPSETLLPPLAPDGSPYEVCTVDYRDLDWTGDARSVVEQHSAASRPPCTGSAWYEDTAFQNGILGFMVLVGRETLAAAGPRSETPEAMVASLRQQGFDRLAAIEVAAAGRCDRGGVQAALFTLTESATRDGLEAMIGSAADGGATVTRNPGYTTISGAGAACVTAIVHHEDTLGWLTAADLETLDRVLASLDLDWPEPQVLGLKTAWV